MKQQDLANAIRCLSGRFKIFDEAGYHNLAQAMNADFKSHNGVHKYMYEHVHGSGNIIRTVLGYLGYTVMLCGTNMQTLRKVKVWLRCESAEP